MSGLILLLVLMFCGWAGVLLVRWVGRAVPSPRWKKPVMVGTTLLLLTAPFVDEVIGKYQFEALCRANGIEGADVSKARGKGVRVEVGNRHPLDGTIMPIKAEEWIYRDVHSGEVLFQHYDYYAMGGWLMRYTPLSMGSHHAMLFRGNGCGWSTTKKIRDEFQITVVE